VDIQEEVLVETLLDNGTVGLVMSSEFARKQEFKLKKLKGLYMRNVRRRSSKIRGGGKKVGARTIS